MSKSWFLEKLLFPPTLSYAETHYKFQLPWSPLWQAWPEIFFDLPFQLVPRSSAPLLFVCKDAHLYPTQLQKVDYVWTGPSGQKIQGSQDFGLNLCEAFHFIEIPYTHLLTPGLWRLQATAYIQNSAGKTRIVWNHNLRGLPNTDLTIQVLEKPLPYPAGWYAGESHCHSTYSSDPVEFGAPLHWLQQMAKSVGLDWVVCTDHSYDFAYDPSAYTSQINAKDQWKKYLAEVDACNHANVNHPLLIGGEEVSCGNSKGRNIHLLVMGHPAYLPGEGDGGRRGFNNHPDLSANEVQNRIMGTPAIAAHPREQIGFLEKLVFRRGQWEDEDVAPTASTNNKTEIVQNKISGLQFWNGSCDRNFLEGRAFWVKHLLNGVHVLPWAANDAHGDFNIHRSVKIPLISLKQNHLHVFGKCRTLLPINTKLTKESIQQSIREECNLCTDGPFLKLEMIDGQIMVIGISTTDFGFFNRIYLYAGERISKTEKVLMYWQVTEKCLNFDGHVSIDNSYIYIRAEAHTSTGCRAITSAHFM